MIPEKTKRPMAQNFLTIQDSLCYSSGALGPHPESENTSIYHGLIRGNGYEMTRKNGTKASNFFHTSYSELIRAHSSGKRSDIDKLCRKLQNDLRPYAVVLANNYHFTTVDQDDFIQEGLISLIRYLPRYRYICPCCGERFERVGGYNRHCRESHGRLMKPVQGIGSFLSGVIRGYMLNFLRSQVRKKRSPIIFVNMFDSRELEADRFYKTDIGPNPETIYASKEFVEKIRDCLDRERNGKIKMFIERTLEGSTPSEAFVEMSQSGMSPTPNSARVSIYLFKKQTKPFREYRQVLMGRK